MHEIVSGYMVFSCIHLSITYLLRPALYITIRYAWSTELTSAQAKH